MSAAASVKGLRMSERISNELRRGGKAAIIRRLGLRDRAVRIAGHRSLSAETIRATSEEDAAASATRATAMLTSVSFSS
jgi:hypothetical protein